MVMKSDRIYLAGDDDQGIYKWNGADPKDLQSFFQVEKLN